MNLRTIPVCAVFTISMALPQYTLQLRLPTYEPKSEKYAERLPITAQNAIISTRPPYVPMTPYTPPKPKHFVVVTAYSSTPDQTDSSPFITASGKRVQDGFVACNFLPIGTKVQFPALYGDKIFTVEDRMARRNSHKIDIWFPTREEAMEFGKKYAEVTIL